MRNLVVFVGMVLFFTSCGVRRTVIDTSAMYDVGVVINDVRWATRNVDTPGTFAKNPESAGGLFTWYEAQDACPRGWRLPTREESQSLDAVGGEWTAVNGVNGRTFGTVPNQLFLPAAGHRAASSGALTGVGAWGFYWCSMPSGTDGAMTLAIDSADSGVSASNRAHGFSVRCVAE